ncbi:MAG: hypothetical protein IT161_21145 [Bryobacterales bacterium]|nr:hypothetical protein [Bryobacterales bacterium]
MPLRPFVAVERDIRNWCATSTPGFRATYVEAGRVWVLKYFAARFLKSFLSAKQMTVSATPGLTWGDGVYVTPLRHPYSTMMYGRAGVMGWLSWTDAQTAYDATGRGIDLYLEWIQYFRGPYRYLATTLHANLANRVLRNAFRRKFAIDVVFFSPDQYNRAYVNPSTDRWFVVSDWNGVGPQAPGQRPVRSARINECEWVAMVEEEFEESVWKVHYSDLFRPVLHGTALPPQSPALQHDLRKAYAKTRTGSQSVVRIEA